MTVGERMTREVVTLAEAQSLRDALAVQMRHRIRHMPVIRDGRLVGIVTDRDLKKATPSLLSGIDRERFDRVLDGTTVGQVMTRDPFSVTPSMRLREAVKILIDRRYGALPVVEGNRLVGIITGTDLLRALHDMLD